jgi:sugar lactone lactonase YvrE
MLRTIQNPIEKFGEPFGIAMKDNEMFISDGETGKIWRVSNLKAFAVLTDRFNTPSGIAFDKNGDLIVADSGSHSIKKVKISTGEIEPVAGVEGKKGFVDGDVNTALFNAPIGIAVSGNKIFVADTYNDKIRLIESGKVSTLAGSEQGFADAADGQFARFDTPCGLAMWSDGKILVADTGNKRLRVVEANGKTWTLSGGTSAPTTDSVDGFLHAAGFSEPIAVAVNKLGVIYVTDENSIRVINRRFYPLVETITNTKPGFIDGNLRNSRLSRPSGLALDESGNLFVADSENQNIRVLTGQEIGTQTTAGEVEASRFSPEEFRNLQPPRWSFNPPEKKREIAGTLGEIRGAITEKDTAAWFHNGLDIVGSYGETASFVRSEKVLRPLTVENFATPRELIRMPSIGYIHIRFGRDKDDQPFTDERFQFSIDESRKINGLRIGRGTKFEAGEAIGTLNSMNHVHLIAGRSGAEMNALDALIFPGISDTLAPEIEKVSLFGENWQEFETESVNERIKLTGRTRIVVRAFDRMDENSNRRKLGVYKIGYQILKEDKIPVQEIKWTISFDRLPEPEAVKFVYAKDSQSGYTPQTIFNYIASNEISGGNFRENFFDPGSLENGNYILRTFTADFFGNLASEDVKIEISK